MSPENIVRLTAAISIVLAFLEPPALPSERAAQDLQELRVRQVDEILQGCKLILETCGQCPYLNSVYTLWEDLSQGLYVLERQLWPESVPDTPLFLALPIEKALGELLLPAFEPHVQYVRQAMRSLDIFHTWFAAFYDVQLHSPFNVVLEDATNIFRTIDTMFRMKQRIIASQPPREPREPIDLDPAAPAAADAPTNAEPAGSSAPAHPIELVGDTGAPLQWF